MGHGPVVPAHKSGCSTVRNRTLANRTARRPSSVPRPRPARRPCCATPGARTGSVRGLALRRPSPGAPCWRRAPPLCCGRAVRARRGWPCVRAGLGAPRCVGVPAPGPVVPMVVVVVVDAIRQSCGCVSAGCVSAGRVRTGCVSAGCVRAGFVSAGCVRAGCTAFRLVAHRHTGVSPRRGRRSSRLHDSRHRGRGRGGRWVVGVEVSARELVVPD